MSVTDPLRSEHSELLPNLERLSAVAESVGDWDPAAAQGVVEFLSGHLIPHARAEEAALYPRVDAALGAEGATASMVADHAEIVSRIDSLTSLVDRVGAGPPDADEAEALKAELYGLQAILMLHFRKEEDVLLPVLDATLSEQEAAAMFAEMVAVAHPAEPDGGQEM